jgi:antitoxin CptB
MDAQVITGRLFWRSRRGLLELELLLVPFMQERYADLPPEAQRSFARLLECEDVDIYDWLQGRSQPPDQPLVSIVDLIEAHNTSRGTPAELLRSEDGATAPD